jgi:hypothetical protein
VTPINPGHDKQTHKTFIRPDSSKCLHYYFYFMDAAFGLIYLRVPHIYPVHVRTRKSQLLTWGNASFPAWYQPAAL